MNEALPSLAVYLHWPYCARICPYCDFNVVRDRGRSAQAESLVQAMAEDLRAQARLAGGARLVSLYFGGGTPSLMEPAHVAALIRAARDLWPGADGAEVTLEANPTDAEAARFAALAQAGVNRLSLGVQALDDPALAFLKRNHYAAQARAALAAAVAAFPRVSLDLICALPGQTLAAWRETLRQATGTGVEHVSAYQLTLEPGTPMTRAAGRGLFTPADADLAAAFHEATVGTLGGLGFDAYEVSNYARGAAARSRHNLAYWRGEAYLGIGPGAHGRLDLDGVRTATEAERGVEAYVAAVRRTSLGWASRTPLSPTEGLEERVMMGLRSYEGVALADVEALGRIDRIAPLADEGWLERAGERIRATASGRLLLDSLSGRLLA